MFTNIDKAIAAAILAVIALLSQFGIAVPDFLNEEYVGAVALVLAPFVVYFVPNKPKKE